MVGAAALLATLVATPTRDARAEHFSGASNRATGAAVRDARERTQRAMARREMRHRLKDDRVDGRGSHVQSPRHGDEDPANQPR
jgi:hypothetical protein